jgi:hypothetical protein
MLASITPLGERGRQNSWTFTVAWFVAGSTAAALGLGVMLGLAGRAVGAGQAGDWRLVLLAAVLAAALALELRGRRLPGPRRQVDERWLDEYRGWVYGVGYGAQLGLAVTTIVVSGGVYVMLMAAVLSGGVASAALAVGSFGLVRGATVLAAAHADTPAALRALHQQIARSAATIRHASVVAEVLLLVALIVLLVAR